MITRDMIKLEVEDCGPNSGPILTYKFKDKAISIKVNREMYDKGLNNPGMQALETQMVNQFNIELWNNGPVKGFDS